jgi:hypothetical protein
MLNRILPKQLDNRYRGRRIALWLFVLLTVMNTGISLGTIFKADSAAQSADGIPLNTYGPAAVQAVIGVVALLGLARLLLCVIFVIALIRYRAMIPLMYVVVVFDWLAHKGIGMMKPIVRAGTSPSHYITWILLAVSVIGLIGSLTGNDYPRTQSSGSA